MHWSNMLTHMLRYAAEKLADMYVSTHVSTDLYLVCQIDLLPHVLRMHAMQTMYHDAAVAYNLSYEIRLAVW